MTTSRKSQSTVLQSNESWMTTEEAADIVCVTPENFSRAAEKKIKKTVRSTRGNGPVGSGYLWCRREVNYVAKLRKKAHLSLNASLRIMVSVRDDNLELSHIAE